MPTPVKSFRPAPIVDAAVANNGGGRGLSHRLAQIADRYLMILDRGRVDLTEAEMNALCDMCASTLHEPADLLPGSLAQGWRDSQADGLARKWEVDAGRLTNLLDGLHPDQEVALIERIEAYWATRD